MGACGAYGLADGNALVAAEIVEDDDVAWLEGRDEELLNPGEEDGGVDRTI
jgi:hypothetical protein